MIVEELISELQQMNPGSQVRFASQPSWPFEYSIDNVVSIAKDEDEENENHEEPKEEDIVYLVEGSQLGYLPGNVTKIIGW